MKPSKPRIYLDTSVISYFTARPSTNNIQRERQHITKVWWEKYSQIGELFVSSYVMEEVEQGSPLAAAKRLAVLEGFDILNPSPPIGSFAKRLLRELKIPHRSQMDARHLAIAAMNDQNYIVSWNFKHMANANIRRTYRSICLEVGLVSPEITTPEEMLEEGDAS